MQPSLFVIVNVTKEFLKRRKASRGVNRTVTMLTSFVVAFAMMGAITFGTLYASNHGFFADKNEETYEHRGMTFPIYNLNKEWTTTLTLSILVSAIGYSGMLGVTEIALFPNAKIYHIVPLNLVLTLLSMGCRYLLEYGEVSNTYNFTVPNIILHIVAVLAISTGFWVSAQ